MRIIALILALLIIAAPALAEDATPAPAPAIDSVPPDQPGIAEEDLKKWLQAAVVDVLTLTPQNYKEKLAHAEKNYFSPAGWESFKEALDRAHFLDRIEAQQVSYAATAGTPQLVKAGAPEGHYMWIFEMPVDFATSSPASTLEHMTLRVLVARADKGEAPHGLGIGRWFLTVNR